MDGGLGFMYDAPFGYRGPFTHLELGRFSHRPEPWVFWRRFAAADDDWTGVYGYVPYTAVRWLLDQHGGFWRFDPHHHGWSGAGRRR
jgi:hypothetical protein